MRAIINYLKIHKFSILAIGAIISFFFWYFYFILKIHISTIRHVLAYTGFGDGLSGYMLYSKLISESGWIFHSDRLGAPFTADFYDFSICLQENIEVCLLKFFIFVNGDISVATNVLYLSLPLITAVVTYIVMRSLKLDYSISVVGSIIYALIPYYFYRVFDHTYLAFLVTIPLCVLICIWCYEDEAFFAINKNFFKYKRNLLGILIAFLIANNGIGYYQFFSCFFLTIVLIIIFIKNKKIKSILPTLTIISLIISFFLINMIPNFIYTYEHGKNLKIAQRSSYEPDLYGLKISTMLLPADGDKYLSKISGEKKKKLYF